MTSGWLSRACARRVKLLSCSRAPRFYTRELSYMSYCRHNANIETFRTVPHLPPSPVYAARPFRISTVDSSLYRCNWKNKGSTSRAGGWQVLSKRTHWDEFNIFVVAVRPVRRTIVDNHHEHMSAVSALCFRPHSDVEWTSQLSAGSSELNSDTVAGATLRFLNWRSWKIIALSY